MNLKPNLKQIILAELQKASSEGFPLAYGTLFDAVIAKRPQTSSDEFTVTLEKLCDAGQVCPLRVNRGGIWQNVYQTNQAALTKEKTSMSNPNTGASKLMRAIVMHGPITGADLAIKTGIAAKSIDSLLDAPNTRDAITSRRGFCAEKGLELKHYMTTTQADDWDAREAAAERRMDVVGQNGNDGEHYAGHVMSAPEVVASTKQSEGEIPVSETLSDNDALAEARRTIQSLHDSIDYMLSDWTDIRQALDVSTQEQAIAEIGNLQRLAKNIEQRAQAPGRLAMAEFDATGQIMDIEYFQPYVDDTGAQQVALNMVNDGHAARVMIIRVIGETHRPPAVFAPMLVPPVQTLREAA